MRVGVAFGIDPPLISRLVDLSDYSPGPDRKLPVARHHLYRMTSAWWPTEPPLHPALLRGSLAAAPPALWDTPVSTAGSSFGDMLAAP